MSQLVNYLSNGVILKLYQGRADEEDVWIYELGSVKFLEHIKLAYFKGLNSLVSYRQDIPMLISGNP